MARAAEPATDPGRAAPAATENKDFGVRELGGAIRALGDNSRVFELSFSSEEPYLRYFGPEILDHSEGCVDLTRLNSIGCVLFNHNRDKVIGKIKRAWIENNRGKAEIEFDTDEEAEVVYQKVKNGTLKGVSVAYQVSVWEEVEANAFSSDGRFKGPCSIAKKWAPYEVSIVSVPADPTVGVGRTLAVPTDGQKEAPKMAPTLAERQLQINRNRQHLAEVER